MSQFEKMPKIHKKSFMNFLDILHMSNGGLKIHHL
eukprot:UN14022